MSALATVALAERPLLWKLNRPTIACHSPVKTLHGDVSRGGPPH